MALPRMVYVLLLLFLLELSTASSAATKEEEAELAAVVHYYDEEEEVVCTNYASKENCEAYDGCGWNTDQQECVDEDDDMLCEDLLSEEDCYEYFGCEWKDDECHDLSPYRISVGQEYVLHQPLAPKVRKHPPTWNITGISAAAGGGRMNSKQHMNYIFVTIPNCLDAAEVETILSLQSQLVNMTEMDDRDDDVEFHHVVHRVEMLLKQQHNDLLDKMIRNRMIHVDAQFWRLTEGRHSVFPEIEFIHYEPPPSMDAVGFGLHVDNGSLLTAVFLLSRPEDFEGGQLIFDGLLEGEAGERPAKLGLGDCVVFCGNQLHHRVTRISKGVRNVLQIELHHTHTNDIDDDEDEDDDEGGIDDDGDARDEL